MKYLYTLLLLIPLSGTSQVPDYFGNNPSWNTGFWCSGSMSCDILGPGVEYEDQIVYYINGTEIIGSETYYKLYKKTYRYQYILGPNPTSTSDEFDSYVRQNNQSIYYYDEVENQDSLLIDYDLNIGDYFTGKAGALNPSVQVESIDSILVGSDYRKVLYSDTVNLSSIIEGIGFLSLNDQSDNHGNFFGASEFFGPGLGFDYILYCYGENNLPLWNSTNTGICQITLDDSEIQSHLDFNIFPNPSINIVFIDLKNTEIENVLIYNLQGQIVHQSGEPEVDISNFESGTYIMEVHTFSGLVMRKQLVKL